MNDYEYRNVLELFSFCNFFVLSFKLYNSTNHFIIWWRVEGVFLKWNSSIVLSIAPARWTTSSVFSGILWILQTGVFHPLGLVFRYFSGRQLIDLKFKWEPLRRTRTTLRECLFAGASQNAPIIQMQLISWRVLQTYKYWHTRLSSKKLIWHAFTCKERHKEEHGL